MTPDTNPGNRAIARPEPDAPERRAEHSRITLLEPPLVPRDGRILRILGICRISTEHQDAKSLDDQEALLRRYVADHYDGPTQWEIISSRGSGQYLDSKELARTKSRIDAGSLDLVVAEDLARLCRRNEAYTICEDAQDSETRLIAINDHIDTRRGDWQLGALISVYRHESYCRDTGKRIRRTLRNRFAQGGVVQSVIFGHIKPPGTQSDANLRKDEAAAPIYDAMFRMLEEGATYSEVADWLNAQGIRPGPACRADHWDAARVRGVVLNPILKGVRVRNRKMSQRVNKTGRSRSVDAPPEERLERLVPHLAFIEPGRYDRVVALLSRRNAKYSRKGAGRDDPRNGVSKKRTPFPGQHLTCGVCGRPYYFGGHGRKTHMMCSGSREYRCWNGVTVDGGLAAEKIAAAVLAEVAALPDFDPVFLGDLRAEAAALHAEDDRRMADVARREASIARAIDNLTLGIASMGPSPALLEKLRESESERDRLAAERDKLERVPRVSPELPSLDEIRRLAAEAFADLTRSSAEAGRLLRRLLPRLEVRPYQSCDGGNPVLRAHLTLDLAPLVADALGLEGRAEVFQRELIIDLFDPPQRVAFRERVMALRGEGLSERNVAAALGLTVTAAQASAALARRMSELGLDDPYIRLDGPPTDQERLRRHKHPQYRFEPLAGHPTVSAV